MAQPKFNKDLADDKLSHKSEEIDLYHLDFNWSEFRTHGMRFPYGLNYSIVNKPNLDLLTISDDDDEDLSDTQQSTHNGTKEKKLE